MAAEAEAIARTSDEERRTDATRISKLTFAVFEMRESSRRVSDVGGR